MNEPKFKVGDKARVLDGSKICGYAGNWVDSMAECVGRVYEVENTNPWYSRFYAVSTFTYRLKGELWSFDERGLELAEDEGPYERITIYREGRAVIAQNELTGEKGVARCSPKDEFNFGFGSYLALKRLFAQGFKIGSYVEDIDNEMDSVFVSNIPLRMSTQNFTVKGMDNAGNVKVTTGRGLTLPVNPFAIVEDKALTYFTGKAVYVGNKYPDFFTKGKIYEFKNGIGCYDGGKKSRKPFKTIEQYNEWLGETAFVEIVE